MSDDMPETDRFCWEGSFTTEFRLDRPVPHRTVILDLLNRRYGNIEVGLKERTDAQVRIVDKVTALWNHPMVIIAPPNVTHVKVKSRERHDWRVRIVDPASLPLLDGTSSSRRGHLFAHRLGAERFFLTRETTTYVTQFEPCDCESTCRNRVHLEPRRLVRAEGGGQAEVVLPAEDCVFHVKNEDPWSFSSVPEPQSKRRWRR